MQPSPGQPHSVSGMPRLGAPVSFKIPKKSQQKPQQTVVPRPPAPPAPPQKKPVENTIFNKLYPNTNGSLKNGNNKDSMFSNELAAYCTRAYNLAKNDIDRDRMEIILKGKITNLFNQKMNVDWSKEPLPVLSSACAPTPPPLPPAAKVNFAMSPIKKRLDYDPPVKNSKGFDSKYSEDKSYNGYGRKRSSDSEDEDFIPLSNKKRKAEE